MYLRTLILMVTVSAQVMSIFEWVMLSASRLGYETAEIRTKTKPLIRYFGILFFMGNFLLGVERMVAVLFVSWYEKYVSTAITAFIVVITAIVTYIVGTGLNALVSEFNTLPKLIFVIVYAILCFTVS
ncbi:hypothetical protein Q1695_006630 [Nippostrongylus brasiliensis]|nr:hypothetical protein Q1695_006630 [Nippostrongylus brasiliensis]